MLAYVAAGPIEDLLVHHGAAFIERVEVAAGRDPIFRKMLGVRLAQYDFRGRLETFKSGGRPFILEEHAGHF